MSRCLLVALCASLALAGCKIVETPKAGAADAKQSDADQMAAKADAIWTPRVLPYIQKHANDFNTVEAALKATPELAEKKYGIRPDSVGGSWNFVVQGKGTIVAADRDSLAGSLSIDTSGDGKADLKVQLGPIVTGTALRDVLTFLPFADFRDQIEYAKFGSALNRRALQDVSLPKGDLVGDRVSFSGVFSNDGAGPDSVLIPVSLHLEGKP